MDNIFTILLYVGALVLIGLVKSINKAGKKKTHAANRPLPVIEDIKKEDAFDFLQDEPVPPKIDPKPKMLQRPLPILSFQKEGNISAKMTSGTPITFVEKEESFIFGEFDLPVAIVYYEILKRHEY